MMRFLPHKMSPWFVLAFLLAHLAYGHIYRQYYHYLEFGLDWSLPQMMICVKLSSFSWAYHDGQIPLEEFKKDDRRRENRIVTLPSLLHYYSFVYCFVGFLTGPFTEFNRYLAFTDRTIFKDNNGEIPSSYTSCSKKLLLCAAAYIANKVHKEWPDSYTTTPEFLQHTLGFRLFYILLCCELGTFKYYFAFSMGETAANIAGLSYNGKDDQGRARWDRVVMMRLWEFKTTQNAKGLVQHWNVPCQLWLKNYVFLRIIRVLNNRTAAVFGTFFCSAVWHGFYPGYYLFFLSGAFFELVALALRKNLRHHFLDDKGNPTPWKVYYDLGSWMLTFWAITYITMSFRLLALSYALQAWSSIYFINHVGGIIVLVFFALFPSRPSKQKQLLLEEVKQKET